MSSEPEAAAATATQQSHHFSDIDVWKYPDRSYYLFITLSVLLGFFGVDHFYLRSFGTGTQKFLVNIFSFGLWYFWDLVQIIFDGDKVRKDGLDSPLEWIRGIGRGVFIDPHEKLRLMADPTKPVVRTKKDLVIYALLTMMFGIFGFDKLYMGHPWQAVTKFLSVFNILFFLFGLMWVVWDIVFVTLYTDSVMTSGIVPPLPFSLLFDTISTKDQFIPEFVTKEQLAAEAAQFKEDWSMNSIKNSHFWMWNWDIWFWNWNVVRSGVGLAPKPSAPTAPTAPTAEHFKQDVFRPLYRELVVPVIQPTALTAVESSKSHAKTIQAAGDLGKELLASVPQIAAKVTEKIADFANPDKMMQQIQAQADAKSAERAMVGGGSGDNVSGPIIAGTLSAIVLAGAGKAIVEMLTRKV